MTYRASLVALAFLIAGRADTARAQVSGIDTPYARVRVVVLSDDGALAGAQLRSGIGDSAVVALTDETGSAGFRLHAGTHRIIATKLGFAPDSLTLIIRSGMDTAVTFHLNEQATRVSGVMVTATRGERRVEAEPTRVEVLDHDEVVEQTTMSPGNVSRFLTETGGVHVAATSPGLGGANVRIQGLRGRYTQLLSDGLPLLGLTTEGLGLLQVPPIDLRHIELIKGAASALYGPSALGGVVNFTSRRPPGMVDGHPADSLELYANQTTQNGTDLAAYAGRAVTPHLGYTLLASANRQSGQDVDHDGFLDVPRYERVVVRPRVFVTGSDGSDLFVTTGVTAENRRGGTTEAGRLPNGASLVEGRRTTRADVGVVGHVALAEAIGLSLRASATGDWRRLAYGSDLEHDRRTTLFSEAAVSLHSSATHDVVLGGVMQLAAYTPREVTALAYRFTTPALFAQDTWTPSSWFGATSSVRVDAHSRYGTFVSPRVSVLLRPLGADSRWTARLSAGAGTYAPTPFLEELEEVGLSQLLPPDDLVAERARSTSADIGGTIGAVELNVSVYASIIDHAVGLVQLTETQVKLVNAPAATHAGGAELFARYRAGRYGATGTYAYQRATEFDVETNARRGVPLTPRNAAGITGTWEIRENSGVSLEAFYTGQQPLGDNPYRSDSRSYVIVGALVRVQLGAALVFLNGENLGNVRQSHFDPLLRRSRGLAGRWTTDAWAPLDGAVVNLGFRVAL